MKERWKEGRKEKRQGGRNEGKMEGREEGQMDGRKEGKEKRQEGKWAEVDPSAGRFWPTGRMFDTPDIG